MTDPPRIGDLLGRLPRPTDAADEVGRPGEQSERPTAAPHDPTGLDVAQRIAEAATGIARPQAKKQRPAKSPTPKRSRRDDPVPLGQAIGKLVEQRGWERGISLKALLDDWSGLVGAANADHSTPEAYADQVLTVRADSTAWAQSLRLLAPQLVARLNRTLGDGTVKRIEVLGPSTPNWKHGLRVVRDGRGPRDTYG